jgi:hypothetical protein
VERTLVGPRLATWLLALFVSAALLLTACFIPARRAAKDESNCLCHEVSLSRAA